MGHTWGENALMGTNWKIITRSLWFWIRWFMNIGVKLVFEFKPSWIENNLHIHLWFCQPQIKLFYKIMPILSGATCLQRPQCCLRLIPPYNLQSTHVNSRRHRQKCHWFTKHYFLLTDIIGLIKPLPEAVMSVPWSLLIRLTDVCTSPSPVTGKTNLSSCQ